MGRGETVRVPVPHDLLTADALAHWHACHCDCSLEGMTEAAFRGAVVADRRRDRTCVDQGGTCPRAYGLGDGRRVHHGDCRMGAFPQLQAAARHEAEVDHTSGLALLPRPGASSGLSQMERRSPSLGADLQAECEKRAFEAADTEARHGWERLAWLVRNDDRDGRFPFAPDRSRLRSRRARASPEERYDCRVLRARVLLCSPSVFRRHLVLDPLLRHVPLPPLARVLR